VFLAGEGKDHSGDDSIWYLVQNFQMYDPMTLLVTLTSVEEGLFEYIEVADEATGATHQIIGLTKEAHGVHDADAVRTALMSTLTDGLSG